MQQVNQNQQQMPEPEIKISDRRLFHADGSSRNSNDLKSDLSDHALKPTQLAQLETELKKRDDLLAEAKQAYRDKLTEFDRFRARVERAAKQDADRHIAQLLLELLDVADLVDSAIKNDPAAQAPQSSLRVIQESLQRWFARHDVTSFELTGQAYDPSLAEAIDTVDVESPEAADKVLKVFKSGYRYQDRLLRAAVVQVSRYPSPQEQ